VGLGLRAWNKLRRIAAQVLDAESAATEGGLAPRAARAHSVPASPQG